MSQLNENCALGELLKSVVSDMSEERARAIKLKYEKSGLNKIFDNADLLETCFCLFENDLNVSLTASKLYMHRNTLIYRINKIKKQSGLNLCAFSDAVIFLLLYALEKGDK